MDRWLKVLLIDDDEDDYILTREMLSEVKRDRFQLDWLTDYREALDEMCGNTYDAYLLDYRLGPYDGLELLQDAIDKGCTAPIIFLTGKGDPEVDVKAMRSGASEYLIKGDISPELLERTIRYAIEHKRVESELKEARSRLAESREAEQLRLAQELHDGPVQDLYGVQFQLKSLLKAIGDENEEAIARVADLRVELQQVTRTLRSICGELRPPTLTPFGLQYAIRSHAERFQKSHPGITVNLQLENEAQRLPDNVRHALYRIYQHALSNVAKHANANCVDVALKLDNGSVVLEIRDDGCGFTVPRRWTQLARHGHLGLIGAAERADSIGGQLDVQSVPGDGTVLRVTAPVASK